MTEDRVRELEDKQNLYREKGSKKKISEQSLLDLWYNHKCFKFIEVPELRERAWLKEFSEKQWVKCLKFDERHKPTHLRRCAKPKLD